MGVTRCGRGRGDNTHVRGCITGTRHAPLVSPRGVSVPEKRGLRFLPDRALLPLTRPPPLCRRFSHMQSPWVWRMRRSGVYSRDTEIQGDKRGPRASGLLGEELGSAAPAAQTLGLFKAPNLTPAGRQAGEHTPRSQSHAGSQAPPELMAEVQREKAGTTSSSAF